MIQHIVLWKLLNEANGRSKDENFAMLRDGLCALPAMIPEVRSLSVVRNGNPDEKSSDTALITTFDSLEDLAVYANHPEHLKVGAFIKTVVSSRTAIDYTI